MTQVTVQSLGVSFAHDLFQDVSFVLADGDRIGVVGNNGGGKTSLLKCVAGLLEPTHGVVTLPKKARLAYVPQAVPPHLEALTLRDAVFEAIPAEERDSVGWRAEMVLDSFGTPDSLYERPLPQLSGGWRRVALIARAWAVDPDILLLDEPTTHLDLLKIFILERWLAREVGNIPLMVASHDRRFLDMCTNRTLFLRPRDSIMYGYPYSRSRELLAESDRALESRKARELKEAQRLRQSAHNLRQIGVNNYSAAALRKSIQIAKRAESIESAAPETHVEPRRDIKLASRDTHAKKMIGMENVVISQPDGYPLFSIGKLEVWQGDRVVLLGRNGTGKTCFVKRLLKAFGEPELARREGVRIAPSVVMGYIDQNMSHLPDDEEIGRFVSGLAGRDRTTPLLIGAGFPLGQHTQKIGSLSAGQRARLALLALRLLEPNLYLMDEATNHIDILGQEQLESEVLEHAATAVLVSHDRAFVEETGNRFVVIDEGRLFEVESPEPFYEALADDVPLSETVSGLHSL
jgi:ATPase subunit of ABC transporter with duplicated ATPase domains